MLQAGGAFRHAPRASLAQPAAGSPRIGWISVADPGIRVEEFRGGLRELGYGGPRELRIDVRIAQRDAPSVRAAVDELLQLPVALIVAHINAATRSRLAWWRATHALAATPPACRSWRWSWWASASN